MTIESNDPNLLAELRRDEGVIPYEYKDTLGYSTIGVGRMIDKRRNGGLASDEIDYLLANDIRRSMAELDSHLPWWRDLSEARQRVLVNMCFNMGIGSEAMGSGLLGFKNTLRMVQTGDYAGAASGMLNSKWARQVGQRAQRLTNMMREG